MDALAIAYLLLVAVVSLTLFLAGNRVLNKCHFSTADARKYKVYLGIVLLAWHLYIYFITRSGITQDFELPPKAPLLLILPALLFLGIWSYRQRNKKWIQQVPVEGLILLQSYRIGIEILFVLSISAGILHPNLTIEGYNYDLLFASTAPIVGVWAYYQKKHIRRILLWWNVLGLTVIATIIFVAMTTIYFPSFYDSELPLMPMAFVQYPYILVAAFLMPLAVGLHLFTLVVLSDKAKK